MTIIKVNIPIVDIQTPSTPSPGENPETIPEVTEPIQQGAFLSVSTMPKGITLLIFL